MGFHGINLVFSTVFFARNRLVAPGLCLRTDLADSDPRVLAVCKKTRRLWRCKKHVVSESQPTNIGQPASWPSLIPKMLPGNRGESTFFWSTNDDLMEKHVGI